jgi:UDP-glucuronate 4-epimerase
MSNASPVLITGAAGFIGFSLARRLLEAGRTVVGVDNLSPYYDPKLKAARLAVLRQFPAFSFARIDVADRSATEALFRDGRFGPVVHLAAQAGVRYSIDHPHAYLDANLAGFLNVLEGGRHRRTEHLIFASSSSVYGANTRLPFSESDNVDHPVSLYAATKKANELMAHAYSHLYGMPMTGLRFFTVYGPWGRPDMAMSIFASAIIEGRPLPLFNDGRMRRDFTFIDDVTQTLERVIDLPPRGDAGFRGDAPNPATSSAPWRIYNIGNNSSVEIAYVVQCLEKELGRPAKTALLPMQPGDVAETCANVDALMRDFDFRPHTPIEEGIRLFVAWFRDYRRG